jgi:hypothetical protein
MKAVGYNRRLGTTVVHYGHGQVHLPSFVAVTGFLTLGRKYGHTDHCQGHP